MDDSQILLKYKSTQTTNDQLKIEIGRAENSISKVSSEIESILNLIIEIGGLQNVSLDSGFFIEYESEIPLYFDSL